MERPHPVEIHRYDAHLGRPGFPHTTDSSMATGLMMTMAGTVTVTALIMVMMTLTATATATVSAKAISTDMALTTGTGDADMTGDRDRYKDVDGNDVGDCEVVNV